MGVTRGYSSLIILVLGNCGRLVSLADIKRWQINENSLYLQLYNIHV